MKKIIQASCSELLVDTQIHDPKKALDKISQLMKLCHWESSFSLSIELLERFKTATYEDRPDVMIYDKEGNRAWLEYGENGYIHTGFRFDSQCNHGDSQCFPIFKEAIDRLNGEMHSCDGGSTVCYEEWRDK